MHRTRRAESGPTSCLGLIIFNALRTDGEFEFIRVVEIQYEADGADQRDGLQASSKTCRSWSFLELGALGVLLPR